MKKLLLSAALLMGAMSMSAQILTEVEEGTYAITSTLEELQAAYDETLKTVRLFSTMKT